MKKTRGTFRAFGFLRSPLGFLRFPLLGVAFGVALSALPAHAKTISDYTVAPPSLDPGVAPLVMLAMSNDHQLYFKAYTDYDDLNGNGKLDAEETGYNHAHKYVGYFEAGYCYVYGSYQFTIDKKADANCR